MVRPSSVAVCVALLVFSCGGESAPAVTPTAAPAGDAGPVAKPKKSPDDYRAQFMARCGKNMPDAPEYCACSWNQMKESFTAEDFDRDPTDPAVAPKFEILRDRVVRTCGRSMPEVRIRASFVKSCAGDNPDKGPFCECTWAELRKTLEAGDMADPEFAKSPRFREVATGTVTVCGDKMPESAVREAFMQGCQSGRAGLETFCTCAWGALRREKSAADIGARRVDLAAMRPKIEKSCGKATP